MSLRNWHLWNITIFESRRLIKVIPIYLTSLRSVSYLSCRYTFKNNSRYMVNVINNINILNALNLFSHIDIFKVDITFSYLYNTHIKINYTPML